MRSYPSYMMHFEHSDFRSLLNDFANQKGISNERFDNMKYIFKNFGKEEISITEKSEYGLPVPVLIHKQNDSKILSRNIII